MAKQLKFYKIHGAFSKKSDANKKHKNVKDSWIIKRKIRGHDRYLVLTER
jgi:hypothetical protein